MRDVFTALYGRFTDSDVDPLVSGLYLNSAQQSAALPYITYQYISVVPEYTFNTIHERVIVQFDIFSESSSVAEICAIYEALAALYDDCKLSVTGYYFVGMERALSVLRKDIENGVWQYTVEYSILIEKQ